ncbi:hypothetical protein LCGC14_1006370 [marine sediment metagenome]|uniref:site-specific DNA-methyltransferase (cytosine-N(4)-specific) n=1 Tax=marine sediment metagenome TaxID=412755 RepID=A0A0F9R7P1_9ZZZZ
MIAVLKADARRIPLGDESVQCVVTSPPYFGLRKYASEQELVWGGLLDCPHDWVEGKHDPQPHGDDGTSKFTISGSTKTQQQTRIGIAKHGICANCGAWRGAYGLEPTVEMYVQHTVEILREIRRVLRDDGVVFWNIGDSYAGSGKGQMGDGSHAAKHGEKQHTSKGTLVGGLPKAGGLKPKDLCLIPFRVALAAQADGWWVRSDIIWAKPNPMPESVTDRPTRSHEYILMLVKGQWKTRIVKFADLGCERVHLGKNLSCQESSTGNPVTKFCISLASTLFDAAQRQGKFGLPPFYAEEWKQMAKSGNGSFVADGPKVHPATAGAARFLCADITSKEFLCQLQSVSVALPNGHDNLMAPVESTVAPLPFVNSNGDGTITVNHSGEICEFDFAHGKIVHRVPIGCKYYWDAEAVMESSSQPSRKRNDLVGGSSWKEREQHDEGGNFSGATHRNLRSVWTFTTKPYPEAHFATFPEELPKRCILAATSEKGACGKCGTSWCRVVDRSVHPHPNRWSKTNDAKQFSQEGNNYGPGGTLGVAHQSTTVGWRPGCACGGYKVRSVHSKRLSRHRWYRNHWQGRIKSKWPKTVACLTLDPFAGSGTVGKVAIELGRRAILCDLAYQDLALKRTSAVQRPLLENLGA